MLHAFISYSRLDGNWVLPLNDALQRAGVSTWLDQRDIPVTLPWLDQINDSIEEALLVVVCDSDRWRSSAACAAEEELARTFEKEIVRVDVGSDLDAAVRSVLAARQQLPPEAGLRTELAVRARDWDRSGRRRTDLIGGRHRRRLLRASGGAVLSGPAHAFLRASRRRSVRRGLLVAGAVTLLALANQTDELIGRVDTQLQRELVEQAEVYRSVEAARTAAEEDPYAGLADAAERGVNESALHAELLQSVLSAPVPDDGFEIPGPAAASFATRYVDDAVTIVATDGSRWERGASEAEERSARPVDGAPPIEAAGETLEIDGRVVELDAVGFHRRIAFAASPHLAQVSPDGRYLAATQGSDVAIADVDTGRVRLHLRGAPGDIEALAWTADSHHLWAIADGGAIRWTARAGRTLIDEPNKWYIGLLPSTEREQRWLVDRDGLLRRLDLADGSVVDQVEVDDRLAMVGADRSGETAYAVGDAASWVIDLERGEVRRLEPFDCIELRPVLRPGGRSAVIPCFGGDVVERDLSTGEVLHRVAVPGGSRSVNLSPVGQQVVVGTRFEGVKVVDLDDGKVSPLWETAGCVPDVTSVEMSPDEDAVVHSGYGIGHSACTVVGLRSGGGWKWNHALSLGSEARYAPVVAFGETGNAFAYGHDNGLIELRPTENLMPVVLMPVSGAPREMVFIDDELFVATTSGVVSSLPACEECVSNKVLAEVAGERLARARALGLTS